MAVNPMDIATPGKSSKDSEVFDLHQLEAELNRLSAFNAELLGAFGHVPNQSESIHDAAPASDTSQLTHEPTIDDPVFGTITPSVLTQDSTHDELQRENAQLRELVQDLDQRLSHSIRESEHWTQQQREYETMLDEKTEIIRNLHLHIQELQQSNTPSETIPESSEDLLQMRKDIEHQRQQLLEDEKAMMKQFRDLEMSLSRDRAELARQRQELHRIQSELARDAEVSGRDATLSDQIKRLRRMTEGQKSVTQVGESSPTAAPAKSEPEKKTSMFRKLFGK